MDVSVIIVTYNSAVTIADCLKSVGEQQGVERETLVIDNASSDQTANVVRASPGKPALIENRENVGFGRACNQGFAASKGRHIYFLNPDAELIRSNALATLCRALSEHKNWGMAGSRVVSSTGQWKKPATTYPDQSHVGRDFSGLPGKIAWVVGASMIV